MVLNWKSDVSDEEVYLTYWKKEIINRLQFQEFNRTGISPVIIMSIKES